MALIDLTPVSVRSPHLVAVCTEFECVVKALVAEHASDAADPST